MSAAIRASRAATIACALANVLSASAIVPSAASILPANSGGIVPARSDCSAAVTPGCCAATISSFYLTFAAFAFSLSPFAWANDSLGRPFTDWRICPHDDADACACRKPRPALFLELAGTYGVDLAASTHVGDSVKDRDAAAAAGIGTFVWPRQFFGWQE